MRLWFPNLSAIRLRRCRHISCSYLYLNLEIPSRTLLTLVPQRTVPGGGEIRKIFEGVEVTLKLAVAELLDPAAARQLAWSCAQPQNCFLETEDLAAQDEDL